MALEKITEGQLGTYGVAAAPDKLTGTAAENKAVFDRLVKQVVAVQYNALVDALTALTGAGEIGAGVEGLEGATVQEVLEAMKAYYDENTPTRTSDIENDSEFVSRGQVLTRDNEEAYTPTGKYHPVTKEYADQLALDAGAVTSVFGRSGPVVAQEGDYTPALVGATPQIVTDSLTLSAEGWCGVPNTIAATSVSYEYSYRGASDGSIPIPGIYGVVTVTVEGKEYASGLRLSFIMPEDVQDSTWMRVKFDGRLFPLGEEMDTTKYPKWKEGQMIVVELTDDGESYTATELAEESPYTQPVEHEAIGEGTRVDLYPTAEVFARLEEDGVTALYVENDGGTAQAVAVGEKPTADLTVQADFVEVKEL